MNGSASIVIIIIGLLLLYAGITGKLDCVIDAWNTCQKQGASGGTTTQPASLNPAVLNDSKLPTTYQDLLLPTFNGSKINV